MPIINQIVKGGGTTPTGSISITSNGTYDVTDKAEAVVNVPTTAPAHYVEKIVDANGVLQNSTNIINLNGVTDVGDYVLTYAYRGAAFPTGTALSIPLVAMSGNSACQFMFSNSTGLTSVAFPSLTTISGKTACASMFINCTGLTIADFSALTTISAYYACRYLFQKCTSLATVYIGNNTAIDFGTETNQFYDMFSGCDQNIDVYAPAANQAQIEAMPYYPNFGGTGTVTWHWRS